MLQGAATIMAAELQMLDGRTMDVEVTKEDATHISIMMRIGIDQTAAAKFPLKKVWRIRDDDKSPWRIINEKSGGSQSSTKKPKKKPARKTMAQKRAERKAKEEAERLAAKKKQAQAMAGPRGMPCWRGWQGDGFGSGGVELVESLHQARTLWTSDIEVGGTWRDQYITGYHGPIHADGRVFFNFYLGDDNRVSPPTPAADDSMVCLDLITGKLLWRRDFPGGADCSPMHRIGPYSTACYADGTVYFQGSTGRVFALNAETGESLWTFTDHPKIKRFEDALAVCVAESKPFNIGACFMHSLQIVDDIVIASGTGLDAKTGEIRWGPMKHIRRPPIRWVHDGTTYLMSGNSCINPRTGEEMWTFTGRTGEQSDVVGEGYLVTNGRGANPDKNIAGEGIIGYRITPEGATKLWQLDPKYHCSRGVSRVIHKGHLYASTAPKKNTTPYGYFFCVELATGKVVAELPGAGGTKFSSLIGCGDYIISETFDYIKADPNDLRVLSKEWHGDRLATCTTHSFGDGFLVLRGSGRSRGAMSRLICLDLRKNPTP